MHITDILKPGTTPISFEFFPPRTADAGLRFTETLAELKSLNPAYASVTYGAGGSTRELTRDWVTCLQKENFPTVIPHLTCVGQSEEDVEIILQSYAVSGVSNILALRGDAPRVAVGTPSKPDAFAQAADLVRFIRRLNERDGHPDRRGFGIGVAGFPEGHPATPNRLLEMDFLKAKVDAGADYICTQFFFDNRDFYDFRDRCILAGIHIPIVAGILPIAGTKGLRRMAELAGGARFPAKLLRRLKGAQGDEAAERELGIEYAIEQVRDLLKNEVDGIHLYTLNQSHAVKSILERLKIPSRKENCKEQLTFSESKCS